MHRTLGRPTPIGMQGLLLAAAIALFGLAAAGTATASAGITLGVFPRSPALQTEQQFQPLARELSKRLGIPVHLDVPPDFAALWDRIRNRRYQLLHYNAYHYIRAHQSFKHQAIAMNVEHGNATVRAAIWVRRDADVRRASDLQHRKIVFGGGRDAMVSHIMALDLLRRAGLADSDFTSQYTINPTHALLAVYFHQTLAAGFAAQPATRRRWGDELDQDALVPLLVGDPVAQHPWAIADSVDHDLRERIRDALLGLADTADGRDALEQAGLTGIAPAVDADYDPHREIVLRVLGERY